MSDVWDGELEDAFINAFHAMDAENPDRICHYCFHPRSSEFCKTSHPYPEQFGG